MDPLASWLEPSETCMRVVSVMLGSRASHALASSVKFPPGTMGYFVLSVIERMSERVLLSHRFPPRPSPPPQ